MLKSNSQKAIWLFFVFLISVNINLYIQNRTVTKLTTNSYVRGTADDNNTTEASPAEQFLPSECKKFLVEEFPTLTSLLEQDKDASMGTEGGEWSACTHIQIYGMNFASFFARHLAYGLKPKSVLEFGCGLGTTSDFLARFVPGGSNVVCVEPEAMLGEVFGEGSAQTFPNRPLQLSMLSFAPEARNCSDALYNPEMKFELVLSLEVAEHVPPEFTDELIQRLATATTKYLVFAAARPGQGGTGHIDESMHNRDWWIERFTSADRGPNAGKLHLLPQLSRGIRYVTGWADRAYDFGTNLIAFGAPGVEDIIEIPQIAHDCSFYSRLIGKQVHGDKADKDYAEKHNMSLYLEIERPCDDWNKKEKTLEEYNNKRAYWVEGQAQALWPELDLLIRRVKSGELKCA